MGIFSSHPFLTKHFCHALLLSFFFLTFQSITLRRLYLISVKCGAIPFNLLCRVQDYLQWNSARIRSKRSCDTREKSCESTTSISTSWWVILIFIFHTREQLYCYGCADDHKINHILTRVWMVLKCYSGFFGSSPENGAQNQDGLPVTVLLCRMSTLILGILPGWSQRNPKRVKQHSNLGLKSVKTCKRWVFISLKPAYLLDFAIAKVSF